MTPQQLDEVRIFREQAYPEIDRWCEAVINRFGTGCKEGCSACCDNVLTVSLVETVVMLRNPIGQAVFQAAENHISELADLFLKRLPETRLKPWRERRKHCVFLSADNRCLVYEDRPFNCRTHIAVEPCDPLKDGNLYARTDEINQASMEVLAAAEKYTQIPMAMAPLPVALIIADAYLRKGKEVTEKAWGNTPFLDVMKSCLYWAYIEL